MKSIKWLDKNFELMILAIILVIIYKCNLALLFPPCTQLVGRGLLLLSGAVSIFLSPMCCAYGDKY